MKFQKADSPELYSGHIRSSSDEYRQVLDALRIGAISFVLDEDLTILWASSCFYQKSGYSEEEYFMSFQTIRQYYTQLLEMQDIVVDAVENGLRALEVFEASAPGGYRAILMDIQMPVMNGYDAAVRIRALNRRDAQTIPIIALTADAFTTDVAKARSAGMNDHIAKPIEMKRLLQVLEKCIKG